MNSGKKILLALALSVLMVGFLPNAFAATLGPHGVWNDLNKNGIQDPDEPWIQGVTIELYKSDGTFVTSAVTDEHGWVKFEGLAPGLYYEKIVLPQGYVLSPKDQGSDDELDSDFDPVTCRTADIILWDENSWFCSVDAGIYEYIPGLTPGFWKHNVGVYLGLQKGEYSDPVNSPIVTKDTMGSWLASLDNMYGGSLDLIDLYNKLCTKGGGAIGAQIRNDAANVFNNLAGLAPL
ncbi:MAG: SdrD B-like domain-containing protein [Candidatus Bathyarchaeia archaeon]